MTAFDFSNRRFKVAVLGATAFLFLAALTSFVWASSGNSGPPVMSLTSNVYAVCSPPGLQFELEICNTGTSPLEQVELDEELPDGMVLVPGTMTGAGPCVETEVEAHECPCEGGVTYLKLRYVGEQCAQVTVTDDDLILFGPGQLCPGDPPFELSGTRSDGRFLKNNLILSVDGVDTVIHESCSKPIGVGSVFGPFEVAAMTSRNGGSFVAPCVPPPPACPCKGGVTSLDLQFNGSDATAVTVTDKGNTIFASVLNSGDVFNLAGSRADGRFEKNNLILNADDEDTTIHVSCSQPIGIGSVFGPFTVQAFSSRDGGAYLAPCDGSEVGASDSDDDSDDDSDSDGEEVEVCATATIAPGACSVVSYIATFDPAACDGVKIEAKTADGAPLGKLIEAKVKGDMCYGQAINEALVAACQDCGAPPTGSLCGLETGVCPTPEQFQCLVDLDTQLSQEWLIYDNQCWDPTCSCFIGG